MDHLDPVPHAGVVSTRRTPGWVKGALACSLGLAVLAAGGVLLAQQDRPAAVIAPEALPLVATPVPSPRPSAVAAPAPTPTPARQPVQLRSAASPELDVASELGPPPGPQVDRRPDRVAAPADRYAFLAGITDYRPPTKDTIGSANDVVLLRESLLAAGWLPGNIRAVTDG